MGDMAHQSHPDLVEDGAPFGTVFPWDVRDKWGGMGFHGVAYVTSLEWSEPRVPHLLHAAINSHWVSA